MQLSTLKIKDWDHKLTKLQIFIMSNSMREREKRGRRESMKKEKGRRTEEGWRKTKERGRDRKKRRGKRGENRNTELARQCVGEAQGEKQRKKETDHDRRLPKEFPGSSDSVTKTISSHNYRHRWGQNLTLLNRKHSLFFSLSISITTTLV